jgi:ArsR family transcriptional regulator
MAITKAQLFDEKHKRIAELAKALGHPARIAILELLAERATCICGDISDELPLAQSTISQHLKALKKSGIIKGEVDGVRTCYCLDEDIVEEFNELFTGFSNKITNTSNEECC